MALPVTVIAMLMLLFVVKFATVGALPLLSMEAVTITLSAAVGRLFAGIVPASSVNQLPSSDQSPSTAPLK